MPKPYSVDLRARVIEDVETDASRREAAERYGISPSVVVIWVQRFEETGSVAAKPSGGSTSPLGRPTPESNLGPERLAPALPANLLVACLRMGRAAGLGGGKADDEQTAFGELCRLGQRLREGEMRLEAAGRRSQPRTPRTTE